MNGLAVSLASRSGMSAVDVADLARSAETAGFDALFVAERAADGLALAHSALLATERLTVGTAIANAGVRHPAITAMTALTLAEESGGRFVLGLGVANAALNQTILGLPATRPVSYMREYVATLRCVLEGGQEPPAGEYFSVSGLVPDRPPAARVPVYLAGLLPKMLSLAGELADGVFLNLMTIASLPATVTHIEAGLSRAGRSRADIVVAALLPCCISSDAAAAADAARQVVVGYAMHPAAGELFSESGFSAELAQVRERLSRGEQGASDSVSDAMIDAFVTHGSPDVLPGRIQAYRSAGVDLPVLFPMPVEDGWIPAMQRIIDAAGPRDAPITDPAPPKRKDPQHV